MRRVLFVDDEPHVLDGLRDRMRRRRKEWDMSFALGGPAALEAFRQQPFDVIVTDMRMPGLDGAALLEQIQRDYPQTVRIVLSGYSEPEAALRAVRVAQQFLSKPCDAASIENAVERACNLQAVLTNERLRGIVGRIETLPSPPETYLVLSRLLEKPEVTTGEIAAQVERDTALSAKLLQVVNSAFFGLPRRLSSIPEAVTYLGQSTIRDLILTLSVLQTRRATTAISVGALQRRSLLTANIARRMTHGKLAEEAFVAGLLHDIGLLVLASELPQAHQQVVSMLQTGSTSLAEAEREVLGVSHEDLGAYLLALWGLPHAIVEAVAFHHRPMAVEGAGLGLPAIIHVADLLAQEAGGAAILAGAPPCRFDPAYLEAIGVTESLDGWREMARALAVVPNEGGSSRLAA